MTRRRYIVFIFLFIAAMQCRAVFANTIVQSPEQDIKFDDDFKDRYSSDKYNYEGKDVVSKKATNPNGSASEFNSEKPNLGEENNHNTSSVNIGFGSLSWLFMILLIIVVIIFAYFLLNDGSHNFFRFNAHRKIESYDKITADNIEDADVQSLINNAENANDYRLATRYYYLLVLKTLSLKNFIKVEEDKTNAEYLNEIERHHFSKDFAYTSYLYNYIWYGEFPLDIKQYNTAKASFITLIKQVKQ